MKAIEYHGVDLLVCSKIEYETRLKQKYPSLQTQVEWYNGIISVGHPLAGNDYIKLAGMENETYDSALPQPWVNENVKRDPEFQYWHYVWWYPKAKGFTFGQPYNIWDVSHGRQVADEILELALMAETYQES